MQDRSALVVGASGLVGAHLLAHLLEDTAYGLVRALGRRPLKTAHPKLAEDLVDFDRLPDHADLFRVNDVFCCLGTTIAKAGSREAFVKVDHTYPLAAARLAAAQGASQFLIVTAIGADVKSAFFYNRVKGQAEEDLKPLGMPALAIFRPSLLLGERQEVRPGEQIAGAAGRLLAPLMVGPLRKYRAIEAGDVATAMWRVARREAPGIHLFESDQIAALAR